MTKAAAKIGIVLAALAVVAAGLSGAFSYGRDYNVHRGFSTLAQLPRAGTGRLLDVRFYSPALHRNAGYLVYLPPHYSSQRRYPVYYLLHGMPGQPKVFVDIANMDVRLDNQLSLGHAGPMILVFPDGRIGGSVFSDSEWANTPSGQFESYVIEVMQNVDQRFATIARRQDRVIAGFSSGAYGAVNIALHHLADFANVQTWSGYFTQTPTGVFAHAGPATLAYNSPIDYVGQLRRALTTYPLRVYMFVGRQDGASRQQLPMVGALQAAGARVQYSFYPGGHDWSVWYPRLNQMLDLASYDTASPPAAVAPVPGRYPTPPQTAPVPHHSHHPHSKLLLVGALLLALISAALINVGFVLQHRGHSRARAAGRDGLAGAFLQRDWLLGQGVGWIGFGGQIVAVALAPLTLVQAFSAGSLALSVPLAARFFGHRVRAPQLAAITVIALCLVSLPIGFSGGHQHLHAGLLIAAAMLVTLVGGLLAPRASAAALAIAAGSFYGVADAGIKAAAVGLRFHGAGLLTGWTLIAGLCTLGGFLLFQAALRKGEAVQPLTLMNAFTALGAVTLGMVVFGEPLGSSTGATLVHAVAIVLVLACVRPLAGAQQQLVEEAGSAGSLAPRPAPTPAAPRALTAQAALRVAARWVLGAAALIVCSVAALGLLYELRQLRWFAVGPRIPDALPLLQLAGFAAQPLARVLVASLLAGLVLGVALIRVERPRRALIVGVPILLLTLVGSDASYALARNLRLDEVLLNRAPAVGPWLEAALIVAASALPGPVGDVRVPELVHRFAAGHRALATGLAASAALAVAVALVLPGGHARAQSRAAHAAASVAPAAPYVSAPVPPLLAPRGHRPLVRPVTGRLLAVRFYSEALRRVADYLVYLPTQYNPARRLPVFYMLHGMPGRPLAFTVNAHVEAKLQVLIRRHRVSPMILVFPDGRINGKTKTDSEWANTPAGLFESYVVDVVHDVDHRFATLPYRQDRAIAGLSAGAYGAANVGLHRAALFGLIQVWSGYFVQTRAGVFSHASRAQLAYDSPLYYARTMGPTAKRYPQRVFLYVGTGDPDRDQIEPMAAALKAAGADAHYAIYPGGHSWLLWSPRIDQMLIMASRDFRSPALH